MRLKHCHIFLELHELQSGSGLPLLLLHQLRGASGDWELPLAWSGPVYGLDFSGHGASDWVSGGGYYPEMLAADADAALVQLEAAAVAGAGLGAYVALMLAGARPAAVRAALLLPGAGLDGAGPVPEYDVPFPDVEAIAASRGDGADPFVEILESFVRPPEYARVLGDAAGRILLGEDGSPRPPWWVALRRCGNAEELPLALEGALARLAAAVRS